MISRGSFREFLTKNCVFSLIILNKRWKSKQLISSNHVELTAAKQFGQACSRIPKDMPCAATCSSGSQLVCRVVCKNAAYNATKKLKDKGIRFFSYLAVQGRQGETHSQCVHVSVHTGGN